MVHAPDHEPCRILLVDDEPLFATVMRQLAKKENVELTYCKSVDELVHLRGEEIDAAVVDWDLGFALPCSGVEVAEYLESFWKGLPVILTSGKDDQQIAQIKLPKVIDKFVPKRMGPSAVLNAAKELARQRAAQGPRKQVH